MKIKFPLYKVYFFGLLTLIVGVLGATGSVYLRKELVKGQEDIPVKAISREIKKKMIAPPPISPIDKGLYYIKACDGDSTFLFAKSQEVVDSVKWEINTVPVTVPTTFFTSKLDTFLVLPPGSYNVTLTYYKQGEADYVHPAQPVEVGAPFTQPDLGQDTAICPDKFPHLLNPYATSSAPAGAKYVWSDGDTTATNSVDSAGNYWVAVTMANGCTQVDEVEVTVYGQGRKRAAIWHFGNQAGMDFNKEPPQPKTDGKMNTPEGNATMSDINGRLLFYTNGKTIFNKSHSVMPNGTQIGGDSTSTQSSIIIPWPGNEPYYYVFTTEDAGSIGKRLMYSLVDMKGQKATGDIPLKQNFLYNPTTEKLTAFGNDSTYWLITHDLSDEFRVYKIDKTGISGPIISKVGSPINSAGLAQGSMKVSTDGKHLAVAFGNSVEVFNFDSTGRVTAPIKLDVAPGSSAYGIEFSPDGSKMYVSQNGPNALYQYAITDSLGVRNPPDSIINSKTQIPPPPGLGNGRYGALQIAPDGKIYLAIEGSGSLGVINNPTGEPNEVDFGTQDLGGKISRLGLPNFVQSLIEPPPGPGIAHFSACYPSPVEFMGSGYGDRDTFTWTFDGVPGPSGFMLTQVQQTLSVGRHYVMLKITNDCNIMPDTFYDTVDVVAGPDPVDLGSPRAIDCINGRVTLKARSVTVPDETYLWSTGETTDSIVVTTPGTYLVYAIKNDCAQFDTVQVYSPTPTVDLGPDRTICQGNSTVLDAGNPGATYSWRRSTDNGTTYVPYPGSSPLSVNTAGMYEVTVTDPITQCIGRDTIVINVSPRPLFNNPTFTAVNPTTCGAADGSILVNPSATNYSYDWRNQSGAVVPAQPADILPHQRSGLSGGIYRVRVTHPLGCDTTLTISLNSGAGSPTAGNQSIVCGTFSANLTVDITSLPAGVYSYALYNQITNTFIGTFGVPTPITVFNTGTYYIVITGGGCTYTVSNIVVTAPNPPLVSLSADPNSCTPNRTITANVTPVNPLYTYRWKAPGSLVFGAPSATNTISASAGSGYYVVFVSDGSACTKDSINVTVNPPLTVTLTNPPPKCVSEGAVTVTPVFPPAITPAMSDRFSYLWTDANGFRDLSKVLSVARPAGTYTYNLTVRNPQNGCSTTGSVTVTINPSPTDPLAAIDATGCAGDTIILDGGNPGATYTWTGPGVTTPNASTINVVQPGVYGLTVDLGGCKSVYSKRVSFGAIAMSELEDTLKFCGLRRESATLRGGPAQINLQYRWSFSSSSSFSEIGPSIVVQDSGYYYLEILNTSTGCSTFDTVHVKNECESLIYVPNAFSPNGVNNKLTIFNTKDVGKFSMTIFNRWGEIVLSTNDKGFAWDGKTSKGTDVPAGTYAYTITYYSTKGDTNRKLSQRGSVAVIR